MQMKETGDLLFNKFLKFEICKNYFLFFRRNYTKCKPNKINMLIILDFEQGHLGDFVNSLRQCYTVVINFNLCQCKPI